MCNKVGIKVIDVDYRLAPEFPYPTSIIDSWEAVKWVCMHDLSYVMLGFYRTDISDRVLDNRKCVSLKCRFIKRFYRRSFGRGAYVSSNGSYGP